MARKKRSTSRNFAQRRRASLALLPVFFLYNFYQFASKIPSYNKVLLMTEPTTTSMTTRPPNVELNLPNFLLAGAQKSGTSAIAQQLMRRPDVCFPANPLHNMTIKEVHFLSQSKTTRDEQEYRRFFRHCRNHNNATTSFGEATRLDVDSSVLAYDATSTIPSTTKNQAVVATSSARTEQEQIASEAKQPSNSGTKRSSFMGFGSLHQVKRANHLGTSTTSRKRQRLDGLGRDNSEHGAAAPAGVAAPAGTKQLSPKSMAKALNRALLHNSCRLFPTVSSVVESALHFDSAAIRQPAPMECYPRGEFSSGGNDSVCSSHSSTADDSNNNINNIDNIPSPHLRNRTPETYKYAINIALMHGASLDVVQLLAQQAPDVLVLPDGPEECGSLSIFLEQVRCHSRNNNNNNDQNHPHPSAAENDKIVRALLRASRAAATVPDRHQNTPLHYAVRAARHLPLQTLALVQAAFLKITP